MAGKRVSKTYIGFVLDRSGSMNPHRSSTVSGFNEYLKHLQDTLGDQEIFFTLVQFNTIFDVLYKNEPLKDVPPLTEDRYDPDGLTALYDAIVATVKKIEGNLKKKDRALIVIYTDGQENSSVQNTREMVFNLIKEKEEAGNWTFAYLGANQDAWAVGASIGTPQGNTANFDASQPHVVFAAMAVASETYVKSAAQRSMNFISDEDIQTQEKK